MFDRTDFRVDPRRGGARCPANKRSIRREAVSGEDPGWKYVFSRTDCTPCLLHAQCTKSGVAARVLQITDKTAALCALRKQQKTKRFRQRCRKRVVVEHRIGRVVQLGVRQARYFGKAQARFQIALALTATATNLMLGAASGEASSSARSPALLVGVASFGILWLIAQKGSLQMAPSRPGL